MANVFLSYAREDRKRAGLVAAALEGAGHSVWWDRHLAAGSEYSEEIASALNTADVIVVLWSKASAVSPWVRDEAAKGRDSGRLVPVSIDGTDPPLGFGQYQTVDLSRRSRKALRELADAIERRSGGHWLPSSRDDKAESSPRAVTGWRPAVAVAAFVTVLALGLLGWRYFGLETGSDKEVALAVMPFADMSPARDQSHVGEGVAEEIMTLVSGTPGLRVIGRTSAWQLSEGGADTIRETLGATHLLEGSVRSSGDELRIAARLIETASGDELWAEEYHRPLRDIFAVQDSIGASVAQRLRGTVAAAREAEKVRSIRTRPEAYKLYLAARAVGRRRDYDSQVEAEHLLEQALAIDPGYAPAHAFLAITLEVKDNNNPVAQDQNRPEDTARALAHARKAVALAPRYAESHVALGMVLDDIDAEAALGALSRGKELDPDNFYAWNISGMILRNRQCRVRESAAEFRHAMQIEPLLHVGYGNLADSLQEMGEATEAEQVIGRFAATGADPILAKSLRGIFYYWEGHLGESLRSWREVESAGRRSWSVSVYMGHLLHHFGKTAEAIKTLPKLHQGLVGNYWRRDYASATATAETIGPAIWNSPHLPQVLAKAMIHGGQGVQLIRLVESQGGGLDGFLGRDRCQLQRIGPTLTLALREAGREADAKRLLRATEAEYGLLGQNGYNPPSRGAEHAAILMLQDRNEEALGRLEHSVERGWLDQGEPYRTGLDDPVFRPIASHPRFRALRAKIRKAVAAQAAAVKPLLDRPRTI